MARRGWFSLCERSAWPLLGGDACVFVAFAAIGHRDHGESGSIVSVVGTALPFIAGWLLTAPWVGVYDSTGRLAPARLLARTAAGWVCAWPVALAIRALTLHRGIPVSFAAVSLLTNLILLVGWRTLYLLARVMRATSSARQAG